MKKILLVPIIFTLCAYTLMACGISAEKAEEQAFEEMMYAESDTELENAAEKLDSIMMAQGEDTTMEDKIKTDSSINISEEPVWNSYDVMPVIKDLYTYQLITDSGEHLIINQLLLQIDDFVIDLNAHYCVEDFIEIASASNDADLQTWKYNLKATSPAIDDYNPKALLASREKAIVCMYKNGYEYCNLYCYNNTENPIELQTAIVTHVTPPTTSSKAYDYAVRNMYYSGGFQPDGNHLDFDIITSYLEDLGLMQSKYIDEMGTYTIPSGTTDIRLALAAYNSIETYPTEDVFGKPYDETTIAQNTLYFKIDGATGECIKVEQIAAASKKIVIADDKNSYSIIE